MNLFPLFRPALLPILLLFVVNRASANVTGIVRGVQENPIAGALVTFASETNPAQSFSGYTDADGRYDIAITTLGVGDVQRVPFTLNQNHPNPFNPSTTITYTTPELELVNLSIYNIIGQKIRTLVSGTIPAGVHAIVWDGRDHTGASVGAGVYLYRLTADGRVETKKMLMVDGGVSSGISMPSSTRSAKSATETWTVTITGDEIEPCEITGLEIADGGTYDFYVQAHDSGNASAWDYECSVYRDTKGTTNGQPQYVLIPSGVSCVSSYQLYCEVDGPWGSGFAFADIWSTPDCEEHIDWDDLSANGGEGPLYDGQGKQIEYPENAKYIMINAYVSIYYDEECEFAAAYSKFSW